MDKAYLDQATKAYLNLLRSKGADQNLLDDRGDVLRRFTPLLEGMPVKSKEYRDVVDRFIKTCDPTQVAMSIATLREYFYFWFGDISALTAFSTRSGFVLHHAKIDTDKSLEALRERMHNSEFQDFPPSLALYISHLYDKGHSSAEIEEVEGYLKLLLFLLHNQQHLPDIYRLAVDALLIYLKPLGKSKYFLDHVRDFYYYWFHFPHAKVRHTQMSAF